MNTRLLRTNKEVYSIDAIKLLVRECSVPLLTAKQLVESAMRSEPVLVEARHPESLVKELAKLGVVAEET